MPELTWVGKDKVITHHLDVPYRVLDRQYSFDATGQHEADNGSENMIIHGDNLEALKALLPKYEGKIDCIYIDPPYNTGNEGWIYNDNVNDPRIKKWLGDVVGKEGEDLSRHDKWLCMMYPRLRLLHRLLSPAGVIFMSIDDHEYSNLKLICDEVFGVANHITTFIWESSGNTDNQAEITHIHEYVLLYRKSQDAQIRPLVDPNIPHDSKIRRDFVENSAIKNGSKNPPSVVTLPAGFPCAVEELHLQSHGFATEFMKEAEGRGYIARSMSKSYPVNYPLRLDDLVVRNGRLASPCRVYTGWMNAKKLGQFIDAGCEPVPEGAASFHFFLTSTGAVYYRKEGRQSHYVQSVLRNMGTTETNKYELEKMGLEFDYPKPVELISYLLSMYLRQNGCVLDSFAGSGTTGHAVLDMNARDMGNRKFILVELGDYAESLTAARVKGVVSAASGLPTSGDLNGSFSYYELGAPLLVDGNLNPMVPLEQVREYIWFTETGEPYDPTGAEIHKDFLGRSKLGSALLLAFDAVAPTVLDRAYLATIPTECAAESYVIYADTCLLSEADLVKHSITFKKIPRDITRL